jgi:hypothetical protein
LKRSLGKHPAHPETGKQVLTPAGKLYGTIVAVYDYGAGFVCDIEKATNKKIEMLPLKPEFLVQSTDGQHLIVQNFEFFEVPPQKE